MSKKEAKDRAKEATEGIIESIKWLDDMDVVVIVLDATENPYNQVNITIIGNLVARKIPVLIIANKSDLGKADVKKIQEALQYLGYSLPKWGVDGLFGPETAAAVKKFQYDNKISSQSINENKDIATFRPKIIVIPYVKEGEDITVVSYGSTLRIVQEAASRLEQSGISCEVVDVQTLLPFDIHHLISKSLSKTNRILFVDEDVPGGATAYMFNKVMEEQNGYKMLDVTPRTLSAKAHRPSYGSDGDYFSKPNADEIADVIFQMMRE